MKQHLALGSARLLWVSLDLLSYELQQTHSPNKAENVKTRERGKDIYGAPRKALASSLRPTFCNGEIFIAVIAADQDGSLETAEHVVFAAYFSKQCVLLWVRLSLQHAQSVCTLINI